MRSTQPLSLTKIYCLVFSSCLLLSVGCASKAEKEARRENAFDLSGFYVTQSNSQVNMDFEIINESGRHDIVVRANRQMSLTHGELDILRKFGVPAEFVLKHFGSRFEMGRGTDKSDPNGGDNISDDFGKTSKFDVCSNSVEFKNVTIRYCQSGTVVKSSKIMTGELTLSLTRRTEVVDEFGKKGQQYDYEQSSLKYSVNMSRFFYKQYLGLWTGTFYDLGRGLPSSTFRSLKIEQLQNRVIYNLQPSTFQFSGDTYEYSAAATSYPVSHLSDVEFPAIEITFFNKRDFNKRISVIAQIWSLGDLTGSVIYFDPQTDPVSLLDFKLKKR